VIEDEGFFNLTNVSVSESVRAAALCTASFFLVSCALLV
jgi:hypothetical protein